MEENKTEEKQLCERLNEAVEEKISLILDNGIQPDNIDRLYKLVDIHKDLKNEKYWEEKEMRYREYNDYSTDSSYGRRGVPGTGRGRYRDSGSYGRRGVDAKYRGEEIMDDMYKGYRDYNDSKDMYGGNDGETMESFKYMVKSFKDYYKHLKNNASSQEEVKILEHAIDEMAEM